MNVMQFVMEAGRRLRLHLEGDDAPDAPGDRGADSASSGVGGGGENARSIREAIEELGLDARRVDIHVNGGRVRVTGEAENQAEREKILLAVGNIDGVSEVVDEIVVAEDDEPSDFYDVKKGDTLYSISKKHYGKGGEFPKIFEANKPMLKDPDRIWPGQKLRIPRQKGGESWGSKGGSGGGSWGGGKG